MKRLLPLLLLATTLHANAGAVFGAASYAADVSFANRSDSTTMTLAYDGNHYYSSSGGGPSGIRETMYSNTGLYQAGYAPGLDFRSIFTNNSGGILARQYASNIIYRQTSPGVFANSVSLIGGRLDEQANVDMNDLGQFVSQQFGNVSVWNANGSLAKTFALNNFSANSYNAMVSIVAGGNYLFTYDSGILKAWDYTGLLLDSTVLSGAGDAGYSLSYTNGRIFIDDANTDVWRGYNINVEASQVPEPGSLALIALALGGLATVRARRRAPQA